MSVSGFGVCVRKIGCVTVERLTFGPPGPMEVRMKVSACGLCQSDVAAAKGKIVMSPTPMVMGHEGAGTIDAVGPGVDNWKIGEAACKNRARTDGGIRAHPHARYR